MGDQEKSGQSSGGEFIGPHEHKGNRVMSKQSVFTRIARCAVWVIPAIIVGCGTGAQAFIPAGIYSGEITRRVRQFVNGVTVIDRSETVTYSETINGRGLPLWGPSKVMPYVGLTFTVDQAGDKITNTITYVNSDGNVVTIGETTEIQMASGANFGGTSQHVYRFTGEGTLLVDYTFTASGTLSTGQPSGLKQESSASLTR